jgi:hypothetical protein
MKHRINVIVSTLMIMAFTMAGIALCANNSAQAAPLSLDVLNNIPANCQFVFGMNVPKFVASDLYRKARLTNSTHIGNDLAQFVSATGVNPERDVDFLVAAGRTKEKSKGEGVVIAFGRFNKDTVTSFIKSKSTPIVQEYNGTQVLMFPEGKGNTVSKGIVFLSGGELALGDLQTLKAVLDVSVNGSIRSNAKMASLVGSIGLDDMFWFAGNADGILANASIKTPMGIQIPSLQNIAGSFNIANSVIGKITASAPDGPSAANLAEVVKGLKAFGQMSTNQSPELQKLFDGVTVSQNGNQVSLDLIFSADLLDKLEQALKMANGKVGSR